MIEGRLNFIENPPPHSALQLNAIASAADSVLF